MSAAEEQFDTDKTATASTRKYSSDLVTSFIEEINRDLAYLAANHPDLTHYRIGIHKILVADSTDAKPNKLVRYSKNMY